MRVEFVFVLLCIASCGAVASIYHEDLATAKNYQHERSDGWISETSLHARHAPLSHESGYESPTEAPNPTGDLFDQMMNAYGEINNIPLFHGALSKVVMAKAKGHTETSVDGVPSKEVLARLSAAGVVAHVECVTRFEWGVTE